jgi:hypothetical protein
MASSLSHKNVLNKSYLKKKKKGMFLYVFSLKMRVDERLKVIPCPKLRAVLRIRIRMFLGLPDPISISQRCGSRSFPFLINVLSGLK